MTVDKNGLMQYTARFRSKKAAPSVIFAWLGWGGLLELTSLNAHSQAIVQTILHNKNSFYYTDMTAYQRPNRAWPVGVFDSGTGGLTVLNAIVQFDKHNNRTGQSGKDGIPDFQTEDFIYLADQANMPYGNYAGVGKTEFLRELILKDAQFLLGNKYYLDQKSEVQTDKKPIKALVIACNTATAYGKEQIEAFLQTVGSPLKVIGVIDAGAKGALQILRPDESASVGVFATAGTVASNGYVNALKRYQQLWKYTGQLQFYSQGGVGLAEAIDQDAAYIDPAANAPRTAYKGPNVNVPDLGIDRTLMELYNFDFGNDKMLCDAKNVDDCSQLQINSADNYVRYHLVSMLEKMRQTPNALPLKALILGCTHYPYMTQTIEKVLTELRDKQRNGAYRYRHLLAEKIHLIDPALNTAQELYDHLHQTQLTNAKGNLANSEFYISVPNLLNTSTKTEQNGTRLTYDFKYGRAEGQIQEDVRVVPFSKQNILPDVAERLRTQIPATFELIRAFGKTSAKTKQLPIQERL
ncbi:MAG: Asp/Glu/hydantoin racemase [Cytophagia bacterium]|nr:MAG: Asp/Glu/hydantoin racemase [Cytophagia bacterium]